MMIWQKIRSELNQIAYSLRRFSSTNPSCHFDVFITSNFINFRCKNIYSKTWIENVRRQFSEYVLLMCLTFIRLFWVRFSFNKISVMRQSLSALKWFNETDVGVKINDLNILSFIYLTYTTLLICKKSQNFFERIWCLSLNDNPMKI